jgi:hypothetical protein
MGGDILKVIEGEPRHKVRKLATINRVSIGLISYVILERGM